MRITESCAVCLYGKQEKRVEKEPAGARARYLERVRETLQNRGENDTAPYMVYQFNRIYDSHFGKKSSYRAVKKEYNELVLSMEKELESLILRAEDPLMAALLYSRIGNYIDFGAMGNVDHARFLQLFDTVAASAQDEETYRSFQKACSEAETFLLIADNCGEIVLDKLFLRQLKAKYPALKVTVLVRGGEVLNDVTMEDAHAVGIDQEAIVISSGNDIAGTIYEYLSDEAKYALDHADVILSKGQGNYESLSGQGRHIFYSLLCKCQLFTDKFQVPLLTGIFVEE